jgi:hypothetical protein
LFPVLSSSFGLRGTLLLTSCPDQRVERVCGCVDVGVV